MLYNILYYLSVTANLHIFVKKKETYGNIDFCHSFFWYLLFLL